MNRATRMIVSVLGVMLGISGINHGFFEALQGNTQTNGLIVQAIGDAQQMWLHGTEEAFTIVPKFLLTGILAMIFGLAIIIWSVGFIHTKHGATVFILLFTMLFLTGGGIGQVIFFIPVWLACTRINKPLNWWRRTLSPGLQRKLSGIWPFSLSVVVACFLVALEIAVVGFVPEVSDPEQLLAICWSLLLAAWILMLFTFVSGFASDLQHRSFDMSGAVYVQS
jgi:hypothetical protein